MHLIVGYLYFHLDLKKTDKIRTFLINIIKGKESTSQTSQKAEQKMNEAPQPKAIFSSLYTLYSPYIFIHFTDGSFITISVWP